MTRRTGIILSYINTALSTVIGLLMSSFIIQSVGQTDYGIYQTVTAFAHYLVLFEMGTGTIINRNISLCKKDGTEDEAIQRNISTLWSITIVLSSMIFAVSFVFYCFPNSLFLRSAAMTAFMAAARNEPCSSAWSPAIVEPPGLHTASFIAPGCCPVVSISCAVPSSICAA